MAVYRNVQLSFWTDNKVEDEFTPEDKYFYLYLLTNPQTNICGCYEVSYSQLTNQTGYNRDTIIRLLERFEKTHNIIRYSKETKEILILNWHKYNWSKSKDTLKGVLKVAEHIKNAEFKKYVFATVQSIGNEKNKTPYRPPIDPVEASVSDTDTDINIINNNTSNYYKPTFNVEKAWTDTFAQYPKKTSSAMAKQKWMDKLLAVVEPNRKDVAVLIINAVRIYVSDYASKNPEDKGFRYIPKFHTWLEEDCDFWIAEFEKTQKAVDDNA